MRNLTLLILINFVFAGTALSQELQLAPAGSPGVAIQAVPVPTEEGAKKKEGEEEEKKRKPGEVVVSTVLEGLNNPFSVAIDGDTDRIFVAESGAQRIVEIKDGKAVEIARDFAAQKYRGYDAGPISICCVEGGILFVGHDNDKGEGSLSMLKLTPNAKDPSKSDIKKETIQVEVESGQSKLNQLSNVMVKHAMVYAVTHGDEKNGWIALAEIQDGKVKSLKPSIATAKLSSYPGPTCVTVSPGGEYLVGSQMGKEGDAKDSRLVFYTLQGKMLRNFEVELQDISALAYSPSRKHLFAIDYNYADPSKGGLYKLIGKGADKCDTKKLQDLPYVTSMAFDSAGNLYLTSLGGPPAVDGKPTGKLIKIEGLDDRPIESEDEEPEEETKEEAK